jgi:hypothetical protein
MLRHFRLGAGEVFALATSNDVHERQLPLARSLVLGAGPLTAEVPTTALATYPSKGHMHIEHVGFQAGTLRKTGISQNFVPCG